MRQETPRFLTQGDTATLSGIVHNYLNAAKTTQISLEVNGAQLLSPAKQTITIDKQGEHRLDWQISVPETGQIKLLARALTNTESDAVEMSTGPIELSSHLTDVAFDKPVDDKMFEMPGGKGKGRRTVKPPEK